MQVPLPTPCAERCGHRQDSDAASANNDTLLSSGGGAGGEHEDSQLDLLANKTSEGPGQCNRRECARGSKPPTPNPKFFRCLLNQCHEDEDCSLHYTHIAILIYTRHSPCPHPKPSPCRLHTPCRQTPQTPSRAWTRPSKPLWRRLISPRPLSVSRPHCRCQPGRRRLLPAHAENKYLGVRVYGFGFWVLGFGGLGFWVQEWSLVFRDEHFGGSRHQSVCFLISVLFFRFVLRMSPAIEMSRQLCILSQPTLVARSPLAMAPTTRM